jgi:hypothetical protein
MAGRANEIVFPHPVCTIATMFRCHGPIGVVSRSEGEKGRAGVNRTNTHGGEARQGGIREASVVGITRRITKSFLTEIGIRR